MAMSTKNAPAPDIMNVREIIEYAFGDFEKNTVNFKLVQTVLFLIARQLKLLERRVQIQFGPLHPLMLPSESTLSVTEVKIHAIQKKKPTGKKKTKVGVVAGAKTGGDKPGVGKAKEKKTGGDLSSSDKFSTDKTSSDKFSTDKTSTDKSSIDKTSTDKTSTDKTSTDKTSTDKTSTDKTSTDKISTDKSSTDKTSTDKTSTDKTSTDKTSTDKTSTDKTSTDKTSTDETSTDKTSADKTSTDKTSSTDKSTTTDYTSSGKTTSSGDKTYTDTTISTFTASSGKTPSSGEKTSTDIVTSSFVKSTGKSPSPGEKTSTDMTTSTFTKSTGKTPSSGEKTSTDVTTSTFITSSGKTPSSGEKTSTDMTTSTVVITSSGKTPSSGEKTSTDMTTSTVITSSGKTPSSGKKTSTDMTTSTVITSSGKTTSSGEKTSADKTTSTDKSSSRKTTSSERTPTDKTSSRTKSFNKEDQGQKRADSMEEGKKTPTPMASVTSMPEAQYEKLLVVQKVPSKEARAERESMHGQNRTPRISVVTQEQFEEVADVVRQLQKKLLPIGTPGFPEHAELMEALRRGASLTDAMSALQLSARLEATEKALAQMMSMVTELAVATPGVELDLDTRTNLGLKGETEQKGFPKFDPGKSGKVKKGKGGKSMAAPIAFQPTAATTSKTVEGTETEILSPGKATAVSSQTAGADQSRVAQYVTYLDLHNAAAEIYHDLVKKAKVLTSRTSTTAETAYKLAVKLEAKLDSKEDVSSKMADLENAVKQYAEQINLLDTGLSSQMTNYQEQLTQMQHDLEIGLDNMAEVFGNSGGDVEAVSELHSHFTGLQVDLENMAFRQKQLQDAQDSTSYDLENLWKEIEMLRDSKSDREEVADALRDKAGIGELNGLVSLIQFEAVRGDFEKRIAAAYDTFNNQEYIWQKAIDDMLKILYEKADVAQVQCLRDEIQKHLNRLKDRMRIIADIVGEPKSAVLSKRVFRDSSCLACGSPAFMDMEEPVKVPALPKFASVKHPSEASEAESQTKGGGDSRPCYPDLPIPHPVDPRAHICKRYCGGSHTVITDGLNRAPQSLVVQQAQRPFNAAPGTDGKLYMVDEESTKIPCLPCNISKPAPVAPEPEPLPVPTDSTEEIRYLSFTPSAHDVSYMSQI